MTCTGNAKVNSRTNSPRPCAANRSISSCTTTRTSSLRHRSSSFARNDGDTKARLIRCSAPSSSSRVRPMTGPMIWLVDRRRVRVGVGEHPVALVVAEHCHTRESSLWTGVSVNGLPHHGTPFARQSLRTFDGLDQQPVLQLAGRRAVPGVIGTGATSRCTADRSTVPGTRRLATPLRRPRSPTRRDRRIGDEPRPPEGRTGCSARSMWRSNITRSRVPARRSGRGPTARRGAPARR